MKKLLTLLLIAGSAVIFADCSSTKTVTTSDTSAADNEKIADLKKSFTDVQMQEGQTIWETKCNKCHKLYKPTERSVSQWENILPRMVKRAKLDDKQSDVVRAYIITHSKG